MRRAVRDAEEWRTGRAPVAELVSWRRAMRDDEERELGVHL